MKCSYSIGGKKKKVYSDVLSYIDNMGKKERTAEDIYRILKSNKVASKWKGNIFVTKFIGDRSKNYVLDNNLSDLRAINRALKKPLFKITQTKKGYQTF